jgi:hypothetical protein
LVGEEVPQGKPAKRATADRLLVEDSPGQMMKIWRAPESAAGV